MKTKQRAPATSSGHDAGSSGGSGRDKEVPMRAAARRCGGDEEAIKDGGGAGRRVAVADSRHVRLAGPLSGTLFTSCQNSIFLSQQSAETVFFSPVEQAYSVKVGSLEK